MGEAIHRESFNSSYHRFETHQYSGVNGENESISGPFKFLRAWTNELDGEQNPDYAEQIRLGLNATTPLVASRTKVHTRPFWVAEEYTINPIYGDPPWQIDWKETYGQVVHAIPDNGDVSALSEVEANNKALTIFVQKVRRQQTTFQGGTFIAELSKTISFIKNPVKRLRGGIRTYFKSLKKSGGRRGFRSLPKGEKLKILSETWLEHSFALKPLLFELDDAVKTLAEHKVFSSKSPFKMIKAVGVEELIDSRVPSSVGSTYPKLTYERVTTSKVLVKYYGLVDVGNTNVVTNRKVGLDWSNWAPTLWEVFPWSFAIDYFVNIDNIISAATLNRSSIRWIAKTIVRDITVESIGHGINMFPSNSVYTVTEIGMTPGASSVSTRTITRDTFIGSLVPDLEFSIPTSIPKLLNLAALIVLGKSSTRNYR